MNKKYIIEMNDDELEKYLKDNDISNDMFDDEDLVKRIAYIPNPFVYMHIIKILETKISLDIIYFQRKRFISLLLNDDKIVHEIPNEWLCEYLANYFFHDYYRNFIINYHQMKSYLLSTNNNLVNIDNLNFYESFSKLKKLPSNDMISFFKNNCEKKNTEEIFYEDMRVVKNHCYNELVNRSIKLKKSNPLYNKSLSKEYNIPIYYLNGEDFNAFVRSFKISRSDLADYTTIFNCESKYAANFSYIGKANITIIGDYKKNVVLLYDNINPDDIMYVFHDDSGMSIKSELIESENINEILEPSSLMSWTKYYNDIIIKNNNRNKPSALVCLDIITDEDILFAKKYSLSIVLINSNHYYINTDFTDYLDQDSYSF